jgi:pyruvate kinase
MHKPAECLPQAAGAVRLHRGDTLWVLPEGQAMPPTSQAPGDGPPPARVSCTLPDALRQAEPGHRIWFDDGRLGGVIEAAVITRDAMGRPFR